MGIYNVYDVVRFVSASKHDAEPEYYPEPGTLGVITSCFEETYTVQWPYDTTSEDDEWDCDRDDIEFVESLLKHGDVVRYTADKTYRGISPGEIGEIIAIDTDAEMPYFVQWPNENGRLWVCRHEVELASKIDEGPDEDFDVDMMSLLS